MHGLLLVAAALLGAPWWLKVLCAFAVVAHGVLGRPPATPTPILVDEDGSCCVPAFDAAWLVPGPRTCLAAHWLRLSLLGGARTRDILLCVDQIDRASWARLNARLRRRRVPGTMTQTRAQRDRSAGSALES